MNGYVMWCARANRVADLRNTNERAIGREINHVVSRISEYQLRERAS